MATNAKTNVFARFKKRILKTRGYTLTESTNGSVVLEPAKCVGHSPGNAKIRGHSRGISIEQDGKCATTPRKCRLSDRDGGSGYATMPGGTPVKAVYRVDPESNLIINEKNRQSCDTIQSTKEKNLDDVDGCWQKPPLCARCHSVTIAEDLYRENIRVYAKSVSRNETCRSVGEETSSTAKTEGQPPLFVKRRQSSGDSDGAKSPAAPPGGGEKTQTDAMTVSQSSRSPAPGRTAAAGGLTSDEEDDVAKRITKSGDSGYSDGPHFEPGLILTSSVEEEVFSDDATIATATGSSSDDEADYTIVGDADVEFACEQVETGCRVENGGGSGGTDLPPGEDGRNRSDVTKERALDVPTVRPLYAHVPKGAARSSQELASLPAEKRESSASRDSLRCDGSVIKVSVEPPRLETESGIDSDNDEGDIFAPDIYEAKRVGGEDGASPPVPLRNYADDETVAPPGGRLQNRDEPTHMTWEEVRHEARTLGIPLRAHSSEHDARPAADRADMIQRRTLPLPPASPVPADRPRLHASGPLRSQSRASLRSLDTGIGQSRSSLSLDAGIGRARLATEPTPRSHPTAAGNGAPSSEPTVNRNADFISSLSKLKDCGWYWGPLNWDDAETKLADKPDGSFLVRDSSDDRYILSLTFRSQATTHHTRIEHYKGLFSFYSQPKSHGATSIVEFIERAMEHSRSGRFLYFLRPRAPGLPPAPIQLLHPASRFTAHVASLQHMCRFSVLRRVRRDHIMQLPVPLRLKDYLQQSQYYAETGGVVGY